MEIVKARTDAVIQVPCVVLQLATWASCAGLVLVLYGHTKKLLFYLIVFVLRQDLGL